MVYCKKCGTENPANAEFCQECGNELNPQTEDKMVKEKQSTGLIVAGYIFAILGILGGLLSVLGLIFGFMLLSRGGPNRTHGIIITIISAIFLFIWIVIASLYVYYAYLAF